MRGNYLFINVPPGLDKDTHDFFEYNPELRYFDCVNSLIKRVGPKVASDVMWATYLVLDPDSKFYGARIEVRKDLIARNFLKTQDFDWDQYDSILSCYPEISMSPAKADYFRIRKLFNSLLDQVEGTDDISKVQSFLTSLDKTYSGLDKAESRMTKEKEKAKEVKGHEQPGKFAKKTAT